MVWLSAKSMPLASKRASIFHLMRVLLSLSKRKADTKVCPSPEFMNSGDLRWVSGFENHGGAEWPAGYWRAASRTT